MLIGGMATARYDRRNLSAHTDTLYVERDIEMPVAEAHTEMYPSNSYAEVSKAELLPSRDSQTVAIRKDSVKISGIEPVSGASFEATITGVQPELKGLSISVPERVITKTLTRPPNGWSFGLCADTYYHRQIDAMAGIYASYTAGPFCFHIDAGAMWSDIGSQRTVNPYVGAGVRIQLYTKK